MKSAVNLRRRLAIVARYTDADAFVFSSEAGKAPLPPDNLWWRSMKPKLMKVGLGWAMFQILRKTNASLSTFSTRPPQAREAVFSAALAKS